MRVKIKYLFLLLTFSLVLVFGFNHVTYAEEISTLSSSVNVTVPSNINVNFNSDGTYTTSQFGVNNQSLVPITVNNFNVTAKNNWTLVPSGTEILKDSRKMSLSINNYNLKVGSNPVAITVLEQQNKNLSVSIERGAWTKSIKESAFSLSISYDICKKDFTLSFNTNGGNNVNSIVAKNGDSVVLPSTTRVGYTFNGWRDSNGTVYTAGSKFIMPIGGANLTVQWTPNTNTKYIVKHHQMNLDGSSYTLSETENKVGTTDSTLTLSSLKKQYNGFTYLHGMVGNEVATNTTILPNGSRVIDLYYSRNKYLLNISGWLDGKYSQGTENSNGVYGRADVYVNRVLSSSSCIDFYTEVFYGSTYEIKNVVSSPGRQFNGYKIGNFNDSEWVSNKGIIGTSGNQVLLDFSTITYNIGYNLNGGSVIGNPSFYNVDTNTFTLSNPTKTGYTFLGWTGSNGDTPQKTVTINKDSTGDRSYIANWKANTYSVVFNSNGGSGTMPNQVHTYGSSLALSQNKFTKTGYNFAGWNTKPDGSGTNYSDGQSVTNLSSTQSANVTLYAKWSVSNYSISYNLNGGINPSNAPISFNINSNAITLPTPTKTGHTFGGWFDNSGLTGTAVTSIPKGSVGNKTYYAKWIINTYYLDVSGYLDGIGESNITGYGTFDVYVDGVLQASGVSDYYTKHPYGSSYEIKNIVPTIGHHYVGSSGANLKGTIGAGHTTVRLSLNTNTYKVVYNANGGTGSTATSNHKYGEAKTLTPNGFSKTGYSFAGWATSASGNVVYSNSQSVSNLTATNGGTVNLYAKWTPNTNTKYVVNHYQMNLDGVNYTLKESESKTGTSDSSITVSNLKKTYTGFTYVNGKVGSSVVTTTTVAPDGSRVINLYYSRNKVVLDINAIVNGKVFGVGTPYMTYDLTVNGVKVQTQAGDGYGEVYYGSSYEVSNINAKPGYTYTGVKTGVIEGQGNGYALKGNVTDIKRHKVFLTFDINNYSITYNLNGGSISGQKTSYTIETATFSLPTPTRAGYLFTGWTGSNGSTPQTSVSIVKGSTGNKSYTANWTPKKLTTTFYRNLDSSDTTTAQQVFTYGLSQSFSAKGWSKTGYTQLGWADSRTATTQQYSTLSGVSDGWIESKYPSNNIYAIWRPNTYNIAYNANGGTGTTATSSHTYDSAKALTSNGFSRTGYTFAGWNTQANGSGTAYTNGQSVKNLTASNGATVTLYAQWKVNNYTLTFNPNGGSVSPTSKSVAYGSQYGTLPTPTRTGYTFTGWFTAASGGTKVSNTTTMGAGNVTVYAQWAPTNYTITYNLNGGTNPSGVSTNYNINTATITLPTPNRSGYTFAGWYTNSSFTGSAVTSIAKGSTGNKVFYAKWTPANYTISYNLNGGSVSGNPTSYNIETATFTLKNPTKTGYTFTGWTGSNGSTAQTSVSIAKGSTGNKSYTANWRANTYTVAYNANGGSGTTASSSHTYGVAKTLTANAFTRTGYTFKGWNTKADGSGASYTNSQSVSNLTSTNGSTVTLYAQWTANTYTYNIVYKSSTGKALGTSTVAGTFGSSKSVSAPAKTGYTTPSAQTVVFDSTSAKTITFTYPIVNYTISYNLNGGSVSGNPSSYNIESATITLKNPSKTGNTFKGWTGSNGTTVQTSVSIPSGSTGNKSYTANWNVNSYTATFNGNGGSAGTSITKPYGSQLGTLPTSSRTGYTFRGWFTAASGGTQITATTTMPASNVTYYAQWTANTYTVNYNANGGTGTTASSSHTYGTAKALTTNGFSKTGHTFLGWSTSPSATTATYTNGQSVSNLSSTNGGTVTLYAVWKVNSYTLTFNPNGGTVSETSRKVAQGSPLGKLPVPTRPGYIFNGWFAYSYGGTQYTESSIMGSSDLTIYASWTQKTTTLIDGPSFNSTLLSMLGNCTKISFTSTSIPSNKISTAKIVSNSNSTNKAYMYVDGSTLFISPDESGVSLIAPVDCTTMFLNAKTVTTLDLSNFNLTTSTAIMKRMFQGMSSLTSLDVSKFKTSNVTDMMQTFQDCRSLTSLDVSKFSTSKVTTMNYMFYGCSSLKTLTLTPGVRPTFVTTSVTDMSFMFAGCNSLPTVNLSSFNTSKVTNMSSMFNGCLSLTSLNLANFNTSNVTSMSGMFADCRSLASLNLSSFTDYNVTNFSYMFSECINLSNLNISNMGLHKATTVREMFYNCPKLSTTVTVRGNPSNYLYMFKYTATASGSMVSVNYTSSTSALVLSMIDTKSPNSNVTLGFTVYSLDSDSSNEESNESVDGVLKPSDTLPNEQPSEELDNVVSTPQVDSNGEDELVDEPSSNVESGTSSDVENEPSSDVDDVPSEDVEEIPPTDNAEEIPSSDTIKTPSDGVPIDTPNEDIPSGNDD